VSPRPERIELTDELGRTRTLPEGPETFRRLGQGPKHSLLMGLGPDPALAASLIPGDLPAYYVEAPAFAEQMPAGWQAAVPGRLRRIEPGDLDEYLIAQAGILLYAPNLRLFPTFWGPLAGRCRRLKLGGPRPGAKSVLLPGTDRGLLQAELAHAFAALGWQVRIADPGKMGSLLPRVVREDPPALVLSVNFQGLDPWGEAFHLLRAAGTVVAAWCVDNPLHLLTAIKAPWWQEARIAVTDKAFAGTLKLHGAPGALHLPLAAWPEHFFQPPSAPAGMLDGLEGKLVFVGRSEFPDREKFFAGCDPPSRLRAEAARMLKAGGRPDFDWWVRELGVWPL